MSVFKITILGLLFAFVTNCKQDDRFKSNSSARTVSIEIPKLDQGNSTHKISDIFDQINCIKLETNRDALFNGEIIHRIIEYNDIIYLLDINLKTGFNANIGDLFSFNKNGTFIRKIGRKGKGPGEYINAYHFGILKDEIYFVDVTSNKIVLYSLMGNFIREITPDFKFSMFAMLDNNSYFFWLNNYNKHVTSKESEIIMCNSKLNQTVSILNDDLNTKSILPTSFIVMDSSLYFNRYFSNTIYSFNRKGTLSMTYSLKFNKDNEIPLDLMKEEMMMIEDQSREKNYAQIFRYYILKDYIYFEIAAKDKYILIYSKKSGKLKLVSSKNIINDVNETGGILQISGAITENNVLIGYVSANDIIKNIDIKGTTITLLSKNIKEDDNPIIVYYKIKEF